MKQYNITFLVDREHHLFFFNKIASNLGNGYNIQIIETSKFRKNASIDYEPSNQQLEEIINYYSKKKINRTSLLRWSQVLHDAFRRYLLFVAKNYYNNYCLYFEKKNIDCICVWSGNAISLSAAIAAARKSKIKTVFFENGSLPNTIAMDTQGINFQSSIPRNPDFYRSLIIPHQPEEQKSQLVKRASRKAVEEVPVKLPDKYLFIPYQVFGDSQIIMFSPWINGMEQLTQLVIHSREQADQSLWLVFKEHPTCKQDYSGFKKRILSSGSNIIFANGNSTQELIEHSQGVITINSSVGIESLLLGKKVITLGQAFYNIEGLVLHADSLPELVDCIKKVQTWHCDESLRNNFLFYLHEYLIEGSWKEPTSKTIESIQERLDNVLDESKSVATDIKILF
jgi:Capsule polysaccharide export protein